MKTTRFLVLLWLGWFLILFAFQATVHRRYAVKNPDLALDWTADETKGSGDNDHPYLQEPLLNSHTAWDSKYYLSIALHGYDDPQVDTDEDSGYSLNYAFFPGYPLLMRVVAWPLALLHQTPVGTMILAGLTVALLGTLGAVKAIYSLAASDLDDENGRRAAFYFLIFPTAFFLGQVYTEGMFTGLAFGCLACLYRKKWVWATLLAVAATWTRAVGATLLLPLCWQAGLELWAWWKTPGRQPGRLRPLLLQSLFCLAPLVAWLLWKVSPLGHAFKPVEENYFGRGVFVFADSRDAWSDAFASFFQPNPQTRIYFGVEFAAIAAGLASCLLTARRHPDLALMGLAQMFIALSSGSAMSMNRYVLSMPTIFLVLARLGKNPVFDRLWTFFSLLFFAMLTSLFVFKHWVG